MARTPQQQEFIDEWFRGNELVWTNKGWKFMLDWLIEHEFRPDDIYNNIEFSMRSNRYPVIEYFALSDCEERVYSARVIFYKEEFDITKILYDY